MHKTTDEILSVITKVIIGKEEICRKVLMTIISGGNCLLEDVPGVGKTTLALAFSKVLGLDYKRIQFTPDTVASDITGFTSYNKDSDSFVYREGAAMTNLLLADEINRTSSKTQSALLEIMEENSCTVDGVTYPLPKPFFVLATQNPIGSSGTMLLPQSQLDRFTVCLSMGYPDFKSQVAILKDRHSENPLDRISAVINKEKLLDIQQRANEVFVSDEIYEYITALVEKTRNHPLCRLGLSPRAALSLCAMGKSGAFMQGRNYVIPEDVADCFSDVASHRLCLSSKARMAEKSAIQISEEILNQVQMPNVRVK